MTQGRGSLYGRKGVASIMAVTPVLVGCLTALAARIGTFELDDTLDVVRRVVTKYTSETGQAFGERVRIKRLRLGYP